MTVMDILIELRWVIYSGFALAIVFFVLGYVDGYRSVEDKINRENLGIGEQPATGRPGEVEGETSE